MTYDEDIEKAAAAICDTLTDKAYSLLSQTDRDKYRVAAHAARFAARWVSEDGWDEEL